jgi:hypothetical protein
MMRRLSWTALALVTLLPAPGAAVDLGDLRIPPDRVPEWNPGVEGGIPNTSDTTRWPVAATLPAGASGAEIQNAIDRAAAAFGDGRRGSVVQLSAGQYTLARGQCLELASNVVLRGAGPDRTTLTGDEGCIHETREFSEYGIVHVSGDSANWHGASSERLPITDAALPRGTRAFTLADASSIGVGDWVRVSVDNDPAIIEDAGARNVLLHTARVVAKSGNRITVDRPLRTAFNVAFEPIALEIYPILNAGVEGFKIENVKPARNVDRGLLSFKFAVNCWARDMFFYRGIKDLAGFESSARNTIADSRVELMLWQDCKVAGNYVDGVPDNCTGNENVVNAYGIGIERGAQDNLVTNNVFRDLYIPVIVSRGAAGNVISYNYGVDNRSGSHGIFFHGHYPYENLVEGNDLDVAITVDEWWGRQGPRNTAFRNRLRPQGTRARFANESGGPYKGFTADQLQLIANVAWAAYGTPCSGSNYDGGYCYDFDGGHAGGTALMTNLWLERNLFRDGRGSRWGLVWKDPQATTTNLENANGERAPAAWAGVRIPASLYLTSRPGFWPASKPWPAIGADVDDMAASPVRLSAQERHQGLPPVASPPDTTPPAAPHLLE